MYKHKISVKSKTLSDVMGRLSIMLCWLQKPVKLLLLFYQELKILALLSLLYLLFPLSLNYCHKGPYQKPLKS